MELSEVAGAEGEEFGVMGCIARFDSLFDLVCFLVPTIINAIVVPKPPRTSGSTKLLIILA